MSINDLCDKAQCVHINMSCVFSLSAVSMLTKKSDVLRNILKIPSSTCTSPFPSARLLCCFVFHVSVWHDCCFMSPLVCTHVLGSPVFVFLFDFLLWQPNHDSAAHFYAADPPSASGQMTRLGWAEWIDAVSTYQQGSEQRRSVQTEGGIAPTTLIALWILCIFHYSCWASRLQ